MLKGDDDIKTINVSVLCRHICISKFIIIIIIFIIIIILPILMKVKKSFDKTSQPRLRGNPCQSCQNWHCMGKYFYDDDDHHHRFTFIYHVLRFDKTNMGFHVSGADRFFLWIFFTFTKTGRRCGSAGQSIIQIAFITAFWLVIQANILHRMYFRS